MSKGNRAVVAFIFKENKILCVSRKNNKKDFGLPGGKVESKEKDTEALYRELLEETGYAGDLQFVTRYLDSAYSNADHYCFVALNCRKVAEPKSDYQEFTAAQTMPLAAFRQFIRTGRLTAVDAAYLGLDYLGLLN
jgi:ADP-ribose pyrophosphatase